MTAGRVQPDRQEMEHAYHVVDGVSRAFARKVVGQDYLRESLLLGLLTGGHILLEGVPGLAKTTAARVVADAVSGKFQRIQCTPDLLPSDIIGTQIYDSSTDTFTTQLGPVHANIVLLDEINRSSAKTQSAMFEAMEERQTTIAGRVYPLPRTVPGDRRANAWDRVTRWTGCGPCSTTPTPTATTRNESGKPLH